MIAATAAKPAAHNVELTWEASFAQFAPQLRDVAAALLEPSIEVVGIRIDDAGPRTPLRFREGIRSEELAYGAVIEIQLPPIAACRLPSCQPLHLFIPAEAPNPVLLLGAQPQGEQKVEAMEQVWMPTRAAFACASSR